MSGPFDLESASIRAGEIAEHAALIALAAEGAIADGDHIIGRKFRAAAWAVNEQLRALRDELDVLHAAWYRERYPK
jgi:hypothetical protein